MRKINVLILGLIISMFTACSNKEQVVEIKQENYLKKVEVQQVKEIEKRELPFNINQKEFLKILENDRYASLCNEEEKFKKIKNSRNINEATKLLNELFVDYTKNLANSCIDLNLFEKSLQSKNAIENKMHYEFYKTDLDEKELISSFNSKNRSVESILEKYTPKHPDFFKFINELKNEKLTKNQRYKLRLNIERLKLLKYQNNDNFIQLNIPSVNFSFYEDGKNIKSFGTVVGEYETQTPILSSRLSYFVINPTWNIPDSIAKSTIIPRALKDKNYLKKKNIVIRKNYNLESEKINFKKVNWKPYLKENVKYIPYKFIQLPSKTNGMGRLKFLFKNDYAVYMHDTIGTWRFKSSKAKIRFNSHGCVRLEHPLGLMKYLSTNYTKYSYKQTRGIYDKFETSGVSLSKKLPIHITYITSYVKNGKVAFYNDVYGYDKIQKLNF